MHLKLTKLQSDGKPPEKHSVGCKTQISVIRKRGKFKGKLRRDHMTCTSCKPGFAFVLRWYPNRVGNCVLYHTMPQVLSAQLGYSRPWSTLTGTNILVTKVSLTSTLIN